MSESDSSQNRSEKEIFLEALDKKTPEERATFLDGVCGTKSALKGRVEALLANHFQSDAFMQKPAVATARPTVKISLAEEPTGTVIGRYKLLQKIGEGGCGVVYMAEQEEPVRRRVALKVIKLGMDTKQVIARFEAERQALAIMDHPNIAKVLDAGATETGRPFFVMELVRGIKMTEYCDQNNVTTPERLSLFAQVCRAVQHAHQKGIIHRDIKPSNILVTMNDGVPMPKVIDFGIAKATQGRLTDQTLFTAFEQFIGTPAYMSPEQAEMSAQDIDTRSDIYSLGVLLYELLTGKTPFDAEDLLQAGLDEMRRTIREKEPARPSTRLSTMLAADLTVTARHRQTDVPKLIKFLRGDLDWIVMKCLEKDRTRRYETANGLAMDLQRHLNSEPVVARPQSQLYRFQKVVRRNKLTFGAAAAIFASLAAGLGVSTWLLLKEREAHRKEMAAIEAQLREQERARLQQERAERETRLRELGSLTRKAIADRRWSDAETLAGEKLALQQNLSGAENLDVAEALVDLGEAQMALREWNAATNSLRAGLAMEKKFLRRGDPKLVAPTMMLLNIAQFKGERGSEVPSPEIQSLLESTTNADPGATVNSYLAHMPALSAAGLIDFAGTPAEELANATKKLAGTTNESDRFIILGEVAKKSFAAGKTEDARIYATELLTLAPNFPDEAGYGIHDGNLILGRIAVAEGRIADAKEYLLKAGKSNGSGVLNTFGPNMGLAKDLLEKGERDAVLQYFDLCHKFWKADRGMLDYWTYQVKAGKIPDFGANMKY